MPGAWQGIGIYWPSVIACHSDADIRLFVCCLVIELENCNHVDVVPFPRSTKYQERFFEHLFTHLDYIDSLPVLP
jgi:hypothetical protein